MGVETVKRILDIPNRRGYRATSKTQLGRLRELEPIAPVYEATRRELEGLKQGWSHRAGKGKERSTN